MFTQEKLEKMMERDKDGTLLFDGPYAIRVLLLRWDDVRGIAGAQEREALSLDMEAAQLRERAAQRREQAEECMRAIEKLAVDLGDMDG